MKKLAWTQVVLGVLIAGCLAYVIYWSRTGLIDKLEGPAFAGQEGAARWLAAHPAFVGFSRWFLWVVGVFGLGVLGLGILQVKRYPDGNQSHPAIFQVVAGFLVAIGALVVLLAVKPDQFILSASPGVTMAGLVDPMWDDPYAVVDFIAVVLGVIVAGLGVWQHTLAARPALPAASVKAGWKNARNAARRR